MDDPLHIRLDAHAVVEASAGTGKTYTIEQLVLRLIEARQVPLDAILLVTFTEKATGELKERLRDALAARLHDTGNLESRPNLQAALDGFDQAPIFTIHGFCQRLLADFAVEQGQDLRQGHVSDRTLVEPALREVQRRLWRQEFGAQLQAVLELADYNRAHAEAWDKKVRSLAGIYRPELGHVLVPAPRPEDLDLEARARECRALRRQLLEYTGTLPANPVALPWGEALRAFKMNGNTRNHRVEKILEPVLRWLGDPAAEEQPLHTFLLLQESLADAFSIPSLKDAFADGGYTAFFEKIAADVQAEIRAKLPGLAGLIDALEAYRRSSGVQRLADQLAVQTVSAVRDVMAEFKAQRGLVSFDDMIAHVARAVSADHARPLLARLRERFRYCIVDEFQDTDPLQWRIFRRIFLEEGESRLIVVGDPKQAIFGFRGADLPTYRAAAQEMQDTFGAKAYPLQVNWRTLDELLQPLNRLFGHASWFAGSDALEYVPVTAPPRDRRRVCLRQDRSDRSPLTIVDLQEAPSFRRARATFARFAAAEICRLLAADITFVHKGETRKLNARDICLLVFRRSEADDLTEALRAAGLPYSFFKQPGLWQSEEAEHLGILLEALAAPDDRAAFRKLLLTSFFRLEPGQLARCPDIPSRHKARVLFDQWLAHADRRQWSALAQSLLEDTGILLHDLEQGDLDRRASNLHYLLATLTEAAYRDNLGLLDLTQVYAELRRGGDELHSDLQPIETERTKVQIMTLHASKGLEYPVVFLSGGFTRGPHTDVIQYHDAANRRVFDLNADARGKSAQRQEELAENRRLLYVGLTRAMLKLYVPLVDPAGWPPGPLATILAPALIAADPAQLGPNHAAVMAPATDVKEPSVTSVEPAGAPLVLTGDLFPTLAGDLGKRRLTVRSFSSLHRAASRIHFGDDPPRTEDEGPELPEDPFRGPVFGDIVHRVLEAIDFAAVGAAADPSALLEHGSPLRAALDAPIAALLPGMRRNLPQEQFENQCRQRIAEYVWRALRTPLPGLGTSLSAIPPSERIQELEFLFPLRFGATPPAEVGAQEGFVTGFMDLVFRREGIYYLLDWKTNLLHAYDAPAIARAMDESGYHRQYRLYLQALRRWLKRRHGEAFDFLGQFGGVYYLFLRGLTGGADAAGIFFRKPDEADLKLEDALAS